VKTEDEGSSKTMDVQMTLTVGEIIRQAVEHRQEVQPKQKSADAVASLIGVDVRTLRRWMDGEGMPDLSQWNAIMRTCVYAEGYAKLKELNFPELR
jgi:hypothetical protein